MQQSASQQKKLIFRGKNFSRFAVLGWSSPILACFLRLFIFIFFYKIFRQTCNKRDNESRALCYIKITVLHQVWWFQAYSAFSKIFLRHSNFYFFKKNVLTSSGSNLVFCASYSLSRVIFFCEVSQSSNEQSLMKLHYKANSGKNFNQVKIISGGFFLRKKLLSGL